MNFKEEYKNSIEIMGPSAEQLERMKKNILEQAKAPEKKAIPFKKIAYIGGAVAACAVISVAAINIVPRLSGGNSNLTASESNVAGGNAFEDSAYNEAAMDAAVDFAPEYPADEVPADYDMELEPKSDSDNATNAPISEPENDCDAADEIAADDACCDDVYDVIVDDVITDDVAEMTGAPTSVVTTTAVNAGSETFAPTEDMTASDDVAQDVVQDIESELSFILSDDLSELVYDDVKYILYDVTGPVDVPVIECMNVFDASGTEYWLDFSSEDYLLLSRDNGNGGFDLIGGYMKATAASAAAQNSTDGRSIYIADDLSYID